MRISAVVVSFRTGSVLAQSLRALRAARADEIVIVDNGNAPSEVALIDAAAAEDRRILVLRGHGNVGFAAGCNRGARAAHGEAVVFVNPDVILAPGALQGLAAALEAAQPPAIVGGDLRDAEGRPERGGRRERLTLWRALVSFTGLSRFERWAPALRDFNRHRDPMPSSAVSVGAVSGALLAAPRESFLRLGGFDEGYFLHVEDIDLCRRAEQAGWRVLFAPGPHGVHVRSSSDASGREIARHKARGFARYFTKFARSPFERALSVALAPVLLALLPLAERPWRNARSS